MDSSQNATFAGTSITLDSAGSADYIADRLNDTSGSTYQYKTNGSLKWYHGLRGLSNNDFYLFNNTASANALVITESGSNATFAGSVTATSFVKSGGTSSQFLMADGSVSTGGGGTIDGSGSANRLAIWSDSDTLTSDVNIVNNGGQLQLGNGLLVEDNDTTVITAKAYEPHIVWQKT